MTAQEILKMIEAVDPGDTAKMDEIDARVWCWQHDCIFHELKDGAFWCEPIQTKLPFWKGIIKYTRSLDAQESLFKGDWYLNYNRYPEGHFYNIGDRKGAGFTSGYLPTEPLARLHVKIQALEYERTTTKEPA